jgi:hypothetical protein
MLITYNVSKFFFKKVNALKMNFDLNNNTKTNALEIKKTTEYIHKTSEEEIEKYFDSLPQSLTKCQSAPDLFSFFWIQKIGRTDLWSLIKKNDLNVCKKYRQMKLNLIQKNSIEKRNNFSFYKNKSKISLGFVVEDKILKYTSEITQSASLTGANILTEYQNNIIYEEKLEIKGSKDFIKLKLLNICIFKKNIRFFIIFILSSLIKIFQVL